jgi:hypothetical protein
MVSLLKELMGFFEDSNFGTHASGVLNSKLLMSSSVFSLVNQ